MTGLELQRPAGTGDGAAVARFAVSAGRRYAAASHLTSILLTDASTGNPVSVDYRKGTSSLAGPDGNLSEVRVRIPAGTRLPARVKAYVIADAFPLESRELR